MAVLGRGSRAAAGGSAVSSVPVVFKGNRGLAQALIMLYMKHHDRTVLIGVEKVLLLFFCAPLLYMFFLAV